MISLINIKILTHLKTSGHEYDIPKFMTQNTIAK